MGHGGKLDKMLRTQPFGESRAAARSAAADYARAMAAVENVVAVLSDLRNGDSLIFSGGFAGIIGLSDYSAENSIWEKTILSLMPETDLDEKYLAELRFLRFLHSVAPAIRRRYYLVSNLRMTRPDGTLTDVCHRMYYLYGEGGLTIDFAICLYGPQTGDGRCGSAAVDSLTGEMIPLCSGGENEILSPRERQVLKLIDSGMTSTDIAAHLSISRHTVSRHRQEILAKLKVKNSVEACRRAKNLKIIEF